jgi:hypothetical protein
MLFLLAGALALAGGAWLATRGAAQTGPATIRVTDKQTSYRRVGRGPGAREIISAGLYSSAGHRIGTEDAICTFLDANARLCHMVFTLPRGEIVTEGKLTSRLLYELGIIGGTELYDNARGTLISTSLGLHPRRSVLIFRLVG